MAIERKVQTVITITVTDDDLITAVHDTLDLAQFDRDLNRKDTAYVYGVRDTVAAVLGLGFDHDAALLERLLTLKEDAE